MLHQVRRYQELLTVRSNKKLDLRLPLFVAFCLIVLGLLLRAGAAKGEEWTKPDLPCTPGLSDFARAHGAEGLVVAGVFWCDLPDGLHTRYATYTFGSVSQMVTALTSFQSGGEDIGPQILKFWIRAPTPAEMEVVAKVEIAHAPRCYVVGTAATAAILTSNAQGFISTAKLDASGVGIRVTVAAPLSCDRLAKETSKRYCNAATLTDTKARRVEGDAWAPCKIERAPAGGWPK